MCLRLQVKICVPKCGCAKSVTILQIRASAHVQVHMEKCVKCACVCCRNPQQTVFRIGYVCALRPEGSENIPLGSQVSDLCF